MNDELGNGPPVIRNVAISEYQHQCLKYARRRRNLSQLSYTIVIVALVVVYILMRYG